MELTSHHQPEEFRKGQKEMPCILPPPRILLTGIHLGWAMGAPPGRMLNQSDWPQKSGNESHHHKTWDWEPRDRSVLLGSLSLLLSAWASLPNTVYRFVSSCLSLDTHPECYTRAFSRVLEGVPLPVTFAVTLMDLETTILSEVSQTETNIIEDCLYVEPQK